MIRFEKNPAPNHSIEAYCWLDDELVAILLVSMGWNLSYHYEKKPKVWRLKTLAKIKSLYDKSLELEKLFHEKKKR